MIQATARHPIHGVETAEVDVRTQPSELLEIEQEQDRAFELSTWTESYRVS